MAGETYNVSWDGEEYNCVAGNLFDGVAIGNSSMFGGDGGNNEPFCIATFGGETMILSLNTGTHVISIAGPVVTIHHLSEDYLKNVVPAIYLNSPCTSGDVEVAFNKRELTGGIVVWDSQVIDLLTSRQDKDGNTIVVTRSAADNATLLRMHLPDNDGLYTLDENWYYGAEAVLYLKSSTSGSGKIFEIRVDDSGELTAREVSK